jgi:uncharacterized protein GlcG (DUF336 family)
MTMPTAIETLTLVDAKRMLAVAEAKASEIGCAVNIAVVDAGGHLIAHVRMDGAWFGTTELAINKAFTARAFDIATKDLGAFAQPGARSLWHPALEWRTRRDFRGRHSDPARRPGDRRRRRRRTGCDHR